MFVRFAASLLLGFAALPAFSAVIDDPAIDLFVVEQDFGDRSNPLIIFGFNPQPEPPASVRRVGFGPTSLSASWTEVHDNQLFVILIGLPKGSTLDLTALPREAEGLLLPAVQACDSSCDEPRRQSSRISLEFTTSSGGEAIDLDEVSFNPQPEPPAGFGDFEFWGLEFGFSSLSTATVTFSVLDGTGVAVPLSLAVPSVPLPATALLGGGAVALLGVMRLRRRPS